MKYTFINRVFVAFSLSGLLLLSACHSFYNLSRVEGGRVQITAAYDKSPDMDAANILAPYKVKVDSIMLPVIGTSEVSMNAGKPESLLSNLVADILREYANSLPGGKAVEVGVVNMGGLRSELPKGNITFGSVYEILPFDNSLCIMTMTGKTLKSLFTDMAKAGGEGLSNARLVISKEGKLLSATVDGKEINDEQHYRVATVDYLAEGNDGFSSFLQSEDRTCPQGAILRQIFMDYIKKQTAQGKTITASIDGRISVR